MHCFDGLRSSDLISSGFVPLLGRVRALSEHTRLVAFGVCLLLVHAYSFQGGGWNQNAQLDVVRALVEQRGFELSAYAANTGDVSYFEGRVYANKPPGLPLLAAPVYGLLYGVERAVGALPTTRSRVATNAYVLSLFVSVLPGVGTVLLLLAWFRREGASEREALLVAGAFGLGTLALPYSGLLMSHNLVAFLLFGGFMAVTSPEPTRGRFALGGLSLGWAVVTDGLALPAALVCSAVLLTRAAGRPARLAFVTPAAACAMLLFAYNVALFGDPFSTNRTNLDESFLDEGLLLGTLGWPEPMRLYWLTVHPFRGLFYCCPVFLVPVLGLFDRKSARDPSAAPTYAWARLGIPLVYLLFNMSFNGWIGGWGVGPRYLIPALPFAFSFALAGYRRFPKLSISLMAVSATIMLSVSIVQLQIPSPSGGRPPDEDPVRTTFAHLLRGEVSITRQHVLEYAPGPAKRSTLDTWDAWNWGERAGLSGAASAVPVVLLTLLVFGLAASGSEIIRHASRRD